MVLHGDQFEEITIYDLLDAMNRTVEAETGEEKVPRNIGIHAATYYGWTKLEIEKMTDDYDNIGIGFKLVEPLDSGLNSNSHDYTMADGSCDLYVEAITERRICCSPVKRKLQRTATFVAERTIEVDEAILENGIINLVDDEHYRYKENQLDVYVNGYKLSKPAIFGKEPELIEQYGYYLQSTQEGEEDIIVAPLIDPRTDNYEDTFDSFDDEEFGNHEFDQSYFERRRGAVCTMFKINRPLNLGDVITYKITTNVYSYDHINNILDNLEARLSTNKETILAAAERISTFEGEIESRVLDVERKVQELNDSSNTDKDDSYFDSYGVLSMSNMPPEMLMTMITSLQHINTNFTYSDTTLEYIVNDIRSHDYLTVVRRDINGYDHFLIPQADYAVIDRLDNDIWKGTIFTVLNTEGWQSGDKVFITGIKLSYGKAGR